MSVPGHTFSTSRVRHEKKKIFVNIFEHIVATVPNMYPKTKRTLTGLSFAVVFCHLGFHRRVVIIILVVVDAAVINFHPCSRSWHVVIIVVVAAFSSFIVLVVFRLVVVVAVAGAAQSAG